MDFEEQVVEQLEQLDTVDSVTLERPGVAIRNGLGRSYGPEK